MCRASDGIRLVASKRVCFIAQVSQGKEIPPCGEDYTCDDARVKSLGYAKKHLAIYTYNIGSYEAAWGDKKNTSP